MRYLITTRDGNEPFMMDTFDAFDDWHEGVGMIIYDLLRYEYTDDGGITWHGIGCE